MKQGFHSGSAVLLFLFILIFTPRISARFLVPHGVKDLEEMRASEVGAALELEKIMGVEDCDRADEECSERRMIAEAHLDYIYTQQRRH